MLAWLITLLLSAPAWGAPAAPVEAWRVCDAAPWEDPSSCSELRTHEVDPQGRMVWLSAKVRLEPGLSDPAAVFVSAYASSAVYWDGKLIGANGRPAAHAALERPGLREAAFLIPAAAPGVHELVVQMSSHPGLLPLGAPVRRIVIAPYERPLQPVLRDYLPALIVSGGLAPLAVVLALSCWTGGWRTSRTLLLAAALLATAQLSAETSRAFIPFAYPEQIMRICVVLALAAGFGFMLLAYLASRFGQGRASILLAVQAGVSAAAVLATPGFDQKTALVLASATGLAMLPVLGSVRRGAPGAVPVLLLLGGGLALCLLSPRTFLDRDLYLWTFALLAYLCFDQAFRTRRQPPQAAPAAPTLEPVAGISIGAGAERRFVVPGCIIRLAAADDYTEVFLDGGASVLHPEPLQALVDRLPAVFLRIHRSHAINLAYLRAFTRGARSSVLLSDESTAPVSRRKVSALLAALEG